MCLSAPVFLPGVSEDSVRKPVVIALSARKDMLFFKQMRGETIVCHGIPHSPTLDEGPIHLHLSVGRNTYATWYTGERPGCDEEMNMKWK